MIDDTLIDGSKPACGLEAIELDGNKHLCKHHGSCNYQKQQKGVPYCMFQERLLSLTDHQAITQELWDKYAE